MKNTIKIFIATYYIMTAILIFLLIVLVLTIRTDIFFYPADFTTWQHDWPILRICLGTLSCPGLSKFPLAYLVNSSILNPDEPIKSAYMITAVNILFVLLPIVVVCIVKPFGEAYLSVIIYLTSLLFSPLPSFYILSGALEVQSGILMGIFFGCLVLWLDGRGTQRALKIACLSAAMMLFYKDTIIIQSSVALLVFVTVVALSMHGPDRIKFFVRLRLASNFLVIPFLFSSVMMLLYNYLRYQTILPAAYFAEATATAPSFVVSLQFFFWSIISPNGGLLAFWVFSYTVFAAGCYLFGLRPVQAALWATGSLLTLSLIAFSFWWAPFGWDSWGNRLIVPASLSVIVAATISACRIETANTTIPLSKLLFLSPLLAYSAYFWAVPLASTKYGAYKASLNPGPHCERMYRAILDESGSLGLALWRDERYYACARERFVHIPGPLWH